MLIEFNTYVVTFGESLVQVNTKFNYQNRFCFDFSASKNLLTLYHQFDEIGVQGILKDLTKYLILPNTV